MFTLQCCRSPSRASRVIFSLQRIVVSRLYFRGDDQLTNTTRVGITGNGDGSHDYRLTGLRKYTQYSVVVKAFNSKGDGPGSDPVTAHTFEDGEWGKFSFIVGFRVNKNIWHVKQSNYGVPLCGSLFAFWLRAKCNWEMQMMRSSFISQINIII